MAREMLNVGGREEFVPKALARLSDRYPAICLQGDLIDGIYIEGERYDVRHLLAQNVMTEDGMANGYDYVVVYNAATKKLTFGDALMGHSEDDCTMLPRFLKEGIDIQAPNPNEEMSVVESMTTSGIVMPSAMTIPDKVFMVMMEALIKDKEKKAFIIIEEANDFIVGPHCQSSASDSIHNEGIVSDFVRTMVRKKGSRLVLIDRNDTIEGRLRDEMPFLPMPPSTERDVTPIVEATVSEPNWVKAIALATKSRITDLLELVDECQGDEERFLQRLIDLKTRQIERMGKGTLVCSMKEIKEEQMAISPQARDFWEGVIELFVDSPDLFSDGIMLVGPPGTGKSICPRYLASRLELPYIKLKDLGTEGLAGKSLEKAITAFEAVIANKPCVLHIDEIDKLFPKGNTALDSNNDDQVRAYVQDMLADDHLMQGVIIIGTSNEPGKMDMPMLRRGRFGKIIAMMPPETIEEKMHHFKAVWHQIPTIERKGIQIPEDDFLHMILSNTPPYATGSDFKAMIQDCVTALIRRNSVYKSIEEALTIFSNEFTKRYPKGEKFDQQCALSIEAHNAWTEDEEGTEVEQGGEDTVTRQFQFIAARRAVLERKLQALEADRQQLEIDRTSLEEEREAFERLRAESQAAIAEGQEAMVRFSTIREGLETEEARLKRRSTQLETHAERLRQHELRLHQQAKELTRQVAVLQSDQAALKEHREEVTRQRGALDERARQVVEREGRMDAETRAMDTWEAAMKATMETDNTKIQRALQEEIRRVKGAKRKGIQRLGRLSRISVPDGGTPTRLKWKIDGAIEGTTSASMASIASTIRLDVFLLEGTNTTIEVHGYVKAGDKIQFLGSTFGSRLRILELEDILS